MVLNEDINEIRDVASSAEDTIDTIGSLVSMSFSHNSSHYYVIVFYRQAVITMLE